MFFDREGNKSLPKRIAVVKKDPRFKSNAFIQRLEVDIHDGNRPSTIKYNASASENEVEQRIYGGFIDLLTERDLEDGTSSRDLADDLVKYAFLEGGVQEAVQIVKYVPMSYLTKGGFASKIAEINWDEANILGEETGMEYYDTNAFTTQYFQHKPWEAVTLEGKDLKSYKAGAETVRIKTETVANVGITVRGVKGKKPPVFISIKNKGALKGYHLYRYAPSEDVNGITQMTYDKISTLGQHGMNEYSTMGVAMQSSVNTNTAAVKAVKQTQTSYEAFIMAQSTFQEAPVEVTETRVIPEKFKTSQSEKYGPNYASVISRIATGSSNKFNQYLAQEFSKLANDLNITVRDANKGELVKADGSESIGRARYGADGASREIILNYKSLTTDKAFEHAFLHELTHHVTHMGMLKDTPARRKLNGVANVLKMKWKAGELNFSANPDTKDLQERYLTYIFSGDEQHKLQELTAFAMSNPEIQQLLQSTEFRNTKESVWDKLMDAWGNILKSLGVKDEHNLLVATLNGVLEISKGPDMTADVLGEVLSVVSLNSVLGGSDLISEKDVVSLNLLKSAGVISATEADIKEAYKHKQNC